MNYTAADHPRHFGLGLGFSSVLCVVVNTAWFIKLWKQLAWLQQVPRWAWQQLILDGAVSVCMSEVTSASREAAVKSRLASWKRQQSGRSSPASSPSAPLTYHFLNFFRCSASHCCQRWPAPDSLLSFQAPVMWHRGDVMQVCSHECLSWNFTLYFSHVKGQCGAEIDRAWWIKEERLFVCKRHHVRPPLSCAASPVK